MGGDCTITDAYNFSHVQMNQYTHIRIILVYACMQRLELISPALYLCPQVAWIWQVLGLHVDRHCHLGFI